MWDKGDLLVNGLPFRVDRRVSRTPGAVCWSEVGTHWWRGEHGPLLREEGITLLRKQFKDVREAVLDQFGSINAKLSVVNTLLRKEHATVLIEMRRDGAIKPERRGRSSLGVNNMPTPEEVKKIKAIYESRRSFPKMGAFAKEQGMRTQKLTNINRILSEDTVNSVPYQTRAPRRKTPPPR